MPTVFVSRFTPSLSRTLSPLSPLSFLSLFLFSNCVSPTTSATHLSNLRCSIVPNYFWHVRKRCGKYFQSHKPSTVRAISRAPAGLQSQLAVSCAWVVKAPSRNRILVKIEQSGRFQTLKLCKFDVLLQSAKSRSQKIDITIWLYIYCIYHTWIPVEDMLKHICVYILLCFLSG